MIFKPNLSMRILIEYILNFSFTLLVLIRIISDI